MPGHGLARFIENPLAHQTYWRELAMLQFTEELHRMMSERKMNRKQLADALGTSKAYVTRVLRGDANFTLGTMVRLASAVGGELRTHIAPSGSISSWQDAPTLRAWAVTGQRRVAGPTLQVSIDQAARQVCQPLAVRAGDREYEREFDVRGGAGYEADAQAPPAAA
ncbi:MAG: helix-turn-helix transcriptional regulator [Thermoleophilia bacterium]